MAFQHRQDGTACAGVACDITFAELDPDQADAAARRALGQASIDVIAQEATGRRKRLLVADMEATIIANEMLEEIADFAGLRAPVAAITRQAMNGEIDFVTALAERAALLKGLPESVLAAAGERIRVTPGAAALVATMRANGARTALVSGGFRVYSSRIRAELGFDRDVANELAITEGRIAGTVRIGATKLETLTRLCAEWAIPLADALAVGDGANDLDMIRRAGLGVAFHAKPVVAEAAGARIDRGDLRSLLYLQGYHDDEIADG